MLVPHQLGIRLPVSYFMLGVEGLHDKDGARVRRLCRCTVVTCRLQSV